MILKTHSKLLITILIVVLFITGLVLRLYFLQLPYWFDEANTIYYITQSLDRMLQFIQYDYSPPLYYLLLRGWIALFGTSEIATGLLSVLFDFCSMAVLYKFVTTLANKRAAIIACTLFWLNYLSVYYATETRMYALVVLLGLLSCYYLWQLTQQPRWYHWLGYVFITLAGMYTHNTFVFLVIAQNFVWLVLYGLDRNRPWPVKTWILSQVGVAFGYLFWLPTIWRQIQFNSQSAVYWTDSAAAKGMFAIPEVLASSLNTYWFPLLNLVLLALVIFLVGHYLFTPSRAEPKFMQVRWFLCTLLFISLVGVYLADILMSKYIIFAYPLFFTILAISIDRLRFPFVQKFFVLSAILFSSSLAIFNSFTTLQETNVGFVFPKLANFFTEQDAAKDIILFNGYPNKITFDYYYQGNIKTAGAFPHSLIKHGDSEISQIMYNGQDIITEVNVAEIDDVIRGYKTTWLVLMKDSAVYDPVALVERHLLERCQLKSSHFFPERYPLQEYVRVYQLNNCRVY